MNRHTDVAELDHKFITQGSRIGKNGRLIVKAIKRNERTELIPVYRRIPYQWQGFHYQDGDDQPFLQLHHSAGGLTNGDTAGFRLSANPGTRTLITTTEATRFYRTETEEPSHEIFDFTIGPGSYLEYLPDETIPYRESKVRRETVFNISSNSHLIATDILSGGRLAYRCGEMFDFDTFNSNTVVKVDGRKIFVDDLALDAVSGPLVLDSWMGHQVLATLICFSNLLTKAQLDELINCLSKIPEIKFGASFRAGLLVIKVLSQETWIAHEAVHCVWAILRPKVFEKPSRKIVKG